MEERGLGVLAGDDEACHQDRPARVYWEVWHDLLAVGRLAAAGGLSAGGVRWMVGAVRCGGWVWVSAPAEHQCNA